MTTKEKAEYLVVTMYNTMVDTIEFGKHIAARKCALIAVDEIIEATNMYQYGINNALEHIPSKIVNHPYWQEVKQEIEKL